jgi:ElaB/YqjD/DUF883 family membrane-anchored ribosome-binding protein
MGLLYSSDFFLGVRVMTDTQLTEELQQLRREFSQVQSDLTQLLNTLAESGQQPVDNAKAETLRGLRAAAASVGSAARRGCETAATIEREIAEHPRLAALGSFGLGYLLGKMVGRK